MEKVIADTTGEKYMLSDAEAVFFSSKCTYLQVHYSITFKIIPLTLYSFF